MSFARNISHAAWAEFIQREAGLFAKGGTIDAVGAAELRCHCLEGARSRGEFFALECDWLSGERLADVEFGVADVQFTHAVDVAGGPNAEAVIGFVRPVAFVVPAAEAGLREV